MMLRTLWRTIPVLVFFGFWEMVAQLSEGRWLPGVWDTLSLMWKSLLYDPIIHAQGRGENGYITHVIATLTNYIQGLIIGSFIGLFLALFIYQNLILRKLFDPLLEAFRVVPPLIVIPLTLAISGSTKNLLIFSISIYSAFSISVYTINALDNVHHHHISLATLLGATRFRIIKDIQLPTVLSELSGALRVTSVVSLGIAVVAEYMAAPLGIGRVMRYAISFTDVNLIVVGVVWAVLIAIIVDVFIVIIFNYMLRWKERG